MEKEEGIKQEVGLEELDLINYKEDDEDIMAAEPAAPWQSSRKNKWVGKKLD